MDIKDFLDRKTAQYNQPAFIEQDPVCIPHLFSQKQDIEIAGLFAAVFAWGNRTIIINKSKELMQLMDHAPYDFIVNHQERDLARMLHFKHRTFNPTDLLYFIALLQHHYTRHSSLEAAFLPPDCSKEDFSVREGLIYFHHYFFSLEDAPQRTRKHISTPLNNSTCKRLNMFLRWMVRKDNCGVDFGIWQNIAPGDLLCPIDLHVARVAKKLGLLHRKQTDFNACLELTQHLRTFDPEDPAKYDYALFGLGVVEKYY